MQTMIDLVKSSVLTQAIITMMVLGTIIYMLVTGRQVDGQLWQLGGLVVGFYFGSKFGVEQGRNQAVLFPKKEQ